MIRVGIIGSGFGLYGLAPAFQQVENCKVVGICGKKSDRLTDYCGEANIPFITEDYNELLSRTELDILAIATSPDQQFKIAKKALEKGIHVFAEKPLGVNSAEVKQLIELAEKNKLKNCVDFIFIQHPAFIEVKKSIKNHSNEHLKSIEMSWQFESYDLKNSIKGWKTDAKKGGGAISFYLSHVLHYLEWFESEISQIQLVKSETSDKSLNRAETYVQIQGLFTSGTKWSIDFNCDNKLENHHEIKFHFNSKTLLLKTKDSQIDFGLQVIYDKTTETIELIELDADDRYDSRIPFIYQLANKFVASIATDKMDYPTFREGLRVQELIDQLKTQQDELLD